MPRIPKSMTCTPSGYLRPISLLATSTPKASSPRKILPTHAISMRLDVCPADDVMLMASPPMSDLYFPTVRLHQGRSRNGDQGEHARPTAPYQDRRPNWTTILVG